MKEVNGMFKWIGTILMMAALALLPLGNLDSTNSRSAGEIPLRLTLEPRENLNGKEMAKVCGRNRRLAGRSRVGGHIPLLFVESPQDEVAAVGDGQTDGVVAARAIVHSVIPITARHDHRQAGRKSIFSFSEIAKHPIVVIAVGSGHCLSVCANSAVCPLAVGGDAGFGFEAVLRRDPSGRGQSRGESRLGVDCGDWQAARKKRASKIECAVRRGEEATQPESHHAVRVDLCMVRTDSRSYGKSVI